MAQKPQSLLYGVEDQPPLGVTLTLGFQHIFLMASTLLLPVAIEQEIGGTTEHAAQMVEMAMIAGGLATILQSLRSSSLGSGYLCPHLCGPSYLSASLLAAKTGGVSLLFSMTVVSGVLGAVFSLFISRLRVLFPTEVTGLVVLMVGIALVPLGVSNFCGIGRGDSLSEMREVVAALCTLALMVSVSVWGTGKWRLYCVLLGIAGGYLIAYACGTLTAAEMSRIAQERWVSVPVIESVGWSFSWPVFVPFLVATLCAVLKTVGDITICQKVNDTEWKRPDMSSVAGGILASSLGTIVAGLLGTMGQSTSSSNIGAAMATGATSRVIGFAAGGLFILLAFFPKLALFFAVMPKSVMGTLLLFVTCFMILSGIQIITARLIDTRKTFLLGLSLIFGLSVDILPGLYKDLPPWLHPLFGSSLSLATMVALILNLLFRIGISHRATVEFVPGQSTSDELLTFMETQGATWGARKDVISRAAQALNEILESITILRLAKGPLTTEVSFDELNLDIDARYEGTSLEIAPTRPTEAALLADEQGVVRLSGFLVRQFADRVTSEARNGRCRVRLHFDH